MLPQRAILKSLLVALSLLLVCPTLQANPPSAAPMSAAKLDLWSIKPIARPALPAVHQTGWVRNPIDAFILARLEAGKLAPSPEADRRTLLRRLSYDLTGLPPAPEETTAFLADQSPDAYSKQVERLLASPAYGERWGRHWLDAVRYADSSGFEMNQPRANAWPYRDYVIRAFNEDKPYDRFVTEQLAGDTLGVDEATGYLVAGARDDVKSPDPVLTAQQRADELHDMVLTTGSTFLGMTVGCARCHDHKFDPITQSDYYSMTALLAGVQHGERPWRSRKTPELDRQIAQADGAMRALQLRIDRYAPLADLSPTGAASRPPVNPRRNLDRFAPVEAQYVRFSIDATNNGAEPCIDELEIWTADADSKNVALASNGGEVTASGTIKGYAIHTLAHLIDGEYGNDKSWISDTAGRGWVVVKLKEKQKIDRVVWGRDRNEKFSDRVPIKYRIDVAATPDDWQIVASSTDRATSPATPPQAPSAELAALLKEKLALDRSLAGLRASASLNVYAGNFSEPPASHRLNRGDPMQPKEEVAPAGIAAIAPTMSLATAAPERDRRRALASWITSPDNPLASRVIVNRLWHYHFGRGLVATPGDFGHMGARPSHPELLDWLATKLISSDWSLKAVQRVIVLSATYRQASDARADAIAIDSDSSLLWRFPPRRLEAEEIRDTILLVSGKLDRTMGGPGFDVFQPNDSYVHVYIPRQQFATADFRRMVYQFRPRLQPDPTFGVFDCPDGGQIAPRRSVSTTPLQCLNLFNSPFMIDQAKFLADRLRAEAGDAPDRQAARAFLLLLGREPTAVEQTQASAFVRAQGLDLFCRTLLNCNEFLHVG